ncbi:RNA polymerase sigma factor [Candidatus Falkowbacteria bacterium]|nr:RNA polymerase sigma factor [Candidatus Falkowbacteria bacterium]
MTNDQTQPDGFKQGVAKQLDNVKEKYFVLQVQYRKDPDAFAKLYDLYIEKIFRFVLFKVSRQEDAEDISADVFLKAWKYIKESEKKVSNFKAFIYQVARNCVIDFYREKNRTFEKANEDQELIEDARDQKDLAQQVENKIEIAAVENYLNKLKEEYREIILLRHVEGFNIKEIAQILGKKSGAIRVLLHRAMKALKEIANENE